MLALSSLALVLLATLHAEIAVSAQHDPVVACFLEGDSFFRPPRGRFTPEALDAALCSRVIFTYAALDGDTLTIADGDPRYSADGFYQRLVALKSSNTHLLVTVAIGGPEAVSLDFSTMVSSPETRKVFIDSVVEFLRVRKLDGLDLDWPGPGTELGTPEDKANYVMLCKELKTEFLKQGWQLAVFLTSKKFNLDTGYDLPGLSEHADLLYANSDYNTGFVGFTSHNAPLNPLRESRTLDSQTNLHFTLPYLLSRGVPAEKLVMALPLYGRSYLLRDASVNHFGAPTTLGFAGPYTNKPGLIGYNEICETLKKDGSRWNYMWQEEQAVPYVVNGDRWIAFDDERSIAAKVKFALSLGLRGVFVWSVDTDDFSNLCGFGKYPLLRNINRLMGSQKTPKKVLACFLASWAMYRPALGLYTVGKVDPNLCTHLVYCFAGMDAVTNDLQLLDLDKDSALQRLVDLKQVNPDLRLILGVGGWGEGSLKYSQMAGDPVKRKAFLRSVVSFLRQNRFDGIAIDWQHPAQRGGKPEDVQNYVILCQELRDAFRSANWHLGVTVSPLPSIIEVSYNLPAIARVVDVMYVVSYNYHYHSLNETGHTAPLYAGVTKGGEQEQLNVNASVSYLKALGLPPTKIVLGLAFLGKSYHLLNASNTDMGAPARPGFGGPYLQSQGSQGYNEVCEKLSQERDLWTLLWDEHRRVPYMFAKNMWVSYENKRSIAEKVRFVVSQGLGGVFAWSIDTDDFAGTCGEGPYPLLTETKKELEKGPAPPAQAIVRDLVGPPVVACFVQSWAIYRPSLGQFNISDVDPNLCTHVVYCFAGMDTETNDITLLDLDKDSALQRLVDLKQVNPDLRLILGVGGWGEGSLKYSQMVADPAKRKAFISNVVSFLREHEFDGIALDWQHPAQRGGKPEDLQNYPILCQEVHEAFRPHGWQLGITISPLKSSIETSYDLPALSKSVDLMFLIAYNFQQPDLTSHTAPVYARTAETGAQREKNLNASLTFLQSQGFAMKSVILGLNLGGKTYTLKNASNTGLGSPARVGFGGPYLQAAGTVGFNELCEKLIQEGPIWTPSWDDEQRIPYIFADNLWVSYEDERSIAEKMSLATRFGLGGAMVWAVDIDDFRGECNMGTYPLLTAVNVGLGTNATRTPPEPTQPDTPSCSVATKADVFVEVLVCGANLTNEECAQGGQVPFGTQVWTNCWSTVLFMTCDPDGSWRTLEDAYADGWRMEELCQPHFVNSPICGRRSEAQNTGDASDLRRSGERAAVSHPWVAGLLRETKPSCTATVITANKLLTAAHCVTITQERGSSVIDVRDLKVQFGSSFQEWVVAIDLHPDYHLLNSKKGVNDIAILTLEKPVRFHSKMMPACVNFESRLTTNASAMTFDLDPDPVFHYDLVEQLFDPSCHSPFDPCFNTLGNASTQFCGRPKVPEQQLRTGSSGGPFLQNVAAEGEKWTVSGVVSQSISTDSCDQRTVLTAAHAYKDWIIGLVNEKPREASQ